eukprot:TRINITY_DN6612_c0_g1_i1.p1 TRINITY_DN6612_c0_g1~~TRINITY_DN6612_c0_g1_i1.p1  ORF type:complete len:1074 (-),score=251.88 TRINITY_DN6612_c0_g1_i1:327-3548(-)
MSVGVIAMYTRRLKCRRQMTRARLEQARQWIRSNYRFCHGCCHQNHIPRCPKYHTREKTLVLGDSTELAPILSKAGNTSLHFRQSAFLSNMLRTFSDVRSKPLLGSGRQNNKNRFVRYLSSEGNGRNSNNEKHIDIDKGEEKNKDTAFGGRSGKPQIKKFEVDVTRIDEHSRLGKQDHLEWLQHEKLIFQSRKRESPFLSKRSRFRKEFLLRLVPWNKINVSWDTFPYFLQEHTKSLLIECATAHLKCHNYASSYGSRLRSSSCRILLQSLPGTELYRERLVKALAHDLQVPLLILDSSVLAPHDYGDESSSEVDTDDENGTGETGEECSSEADSDDENDASNEEEWASSETKEDASDVDTDPDVAARAIKKLAPYALEDFEKRLSAEDAEKVKQSKGKSDDCDSSQQPKDTFRKGDRIKYTGVHEPNTIKTRVDLGKIPTQLGPTSAFTYINRRPLVKGQHGEVYEINGDKVAIILDRDEITTEAGSSQGCLLPPDGKATLYWVDVHDIEHDLDTQTEDWFIALEALRETISSLQPVIVYFPDCSLWLSRAAPKSKRKEFVQRVEEVFDQIPGPVLMICGQNKAQSESKEKDKMTMFLPNFGRLGQLPIPLKRLTEGLRGGRGSKTDDVSKLFVNAFNIHPPKDFELLKTLNQQLEADRTIIISRSNWSELHKVLEEHNLACPDLLNVQTDGLILTNEKADKVVGWARNHYLSLCDLSPTIVGDKLSLPKESLEVALSRLKEEEDFHKKPSQNLKSLARDEYETNFLSAVVTPEEIGVKFDDIGALDNVKKTLKELVILPMQRPELFSHGNLLRPCNGVLLFGPPGTGKTLLAKALATEAGANFLSITGSTLTSKWFGDAEKLTKALFSFASRLAPVIIFIDEVDSILGARGGAFEHEATRRMRNEFMSAWDGLRSKENQRILILGATNRPFDLDDAVIRRLPRRIYVDLPDTENRVKILQTILSKEKLVDGFDFVELARATEGYSGSDLKNLCVTAAYRPVQELLEEEKKMGKVNSNPSLRMLTLDDFIAAKAKVSPSIAFDAVSMNELRKWNDQYGEGGSRKKSPFGFVI